MREWGVPAVVAAVVVGCGVVAGCGASPATRQPTTTSSSAAPSASTESPASTAARLGWRVPVPDGWVTVDRTSLRQMSSSQVSDLASRMSVDAPFLERIRGVEGFELYAADPDVPADLRVLYSPTRILPTREVAEALVADFDGRDIEPASIDSPLGRLAMFTFRSGDAFGVVLVGSAGRQASGVIWLLADSPQRLLELTQQTASGLAATT